MLLKLVNLDNPILRLKAKEVEDFVHARQIVYDMYDTMIENKGVGLAAPQVGFSLQLFITAKHPNIDSYMFKYKKPLPFNVFVNPSIIVASGDVSGEEGCLSIPNTIVQVRRPALVSFEADDLAGSRTQYTLINAWARIFCHEYDHLLGKLITDFI